MQDRTIDKDSFQADFEASMDFMRLHGWCAQAEERTNALRSTARENPALSASRALMAGKKLDKAETTEEALFCLAVLQDLGIPAEKTAEIIFGRLYGKLSDMNAEFFSSQFFEGIDPVPDYISFELTDRVFLTYQRAIYHALKIDGFESDFDAPRILVFLTQLLCRSNVNPQNKAMIYLLISRIDTDLPESVETAVRRAIGQLKSVIKEVEEKKEKALSAGYESATGLLLEFEQEAARQSKPLGSRYQDGASFASREGSASGTKGKSKKETQKDVTETAGKSALHETAMPVQEDAKFTVKKMPATDAVPPGPSSIIAGTPKAEGTAADKDRTQKTTGETKDIEIGVPLASKQDSGSKAGKTESNKPDSVPKVDPASDKSQAARAKFKIRFSKEIPELSEILRLLREREGTHADENAAEEGNPFGEVASLETPNIYGKRVSEKEGNRAGNLSDGKSSRRKEKEPESRTEPANETASQKPEDPGQANSALKRETVSDQAMSVNQATLAKPVIAEKQSTPDNPEISSKPEIKGKKSSPVKVPESDSPATPENLPSYDEHSQPGGKGVAEKANLKVDTAAIEGKNATTARAASQESKSSIPQSSTGKKPTRKAQIAIMAAGLILVIGVVMGGLYVRQRNAASQVAQAPVSGNQDTSQNPQPVIEPDPETTVPAPAAIETETKTAAESADMVAQPVSSQRLSETLGTDMRSEGNALVWYPRANESLWWLFNAIQSSGTKVGYLKDLVADGWIPYTRKIRSLNPFMDADYTIYAYAPLIIGNED